MAATANGSSSTRRRSGLRGVLGVRLGFVNRIGQADGFAVTERFAEPPEFFASQDTVRAPFRRSARSPSRGCLQRRLPHAAPPNSRLPTQARVPGLPDRARRKAWLCIFGHVRAPNVHNPLWADGGQNVAIQERCVFVRSFSSALPTCNLMKSVATALKVRTSRAALRCATGSCAALLTAPRR